MSCKCARVTDEWHGWECTVTEGACEFLVPDSKRCAELFGEGPDAEVDNLDEEIGCLNCEFTRVEDDKEPCSKCVDYSEWKTDEWMYK